MKYLTRRSDLSLWIQCYRPQARDTIPLISETGSRAGAIGQKVEAQIRRFTVINNIRGHQRLKYQYTLSGAKGTILQTIPVFGRAYFPYS